MKIENLKTLQKVIAVCRKNGVSAIEIDGIKMNITLEVSKPQPTDYSSDFPEASIRVPKYDPASPVEAATKIATEELSPDQLLFYSSIPTDASQEQQ